VTESVITTVVLLKFKPFLFRDITQ